MLLDTIAAISSGYVNQPISVIRLSGPESFEIVRKIFTGKEGTDKTITYGNIKDEAGIVDEVLVMWFKGPKTFTGEDVVEINAHGGTVVSNKILKLLLSNGARLAENGEFSRRAFMNGKLDLVKAEAIHDLIFAKTEEQVSLSVKKFDGRTSKLIEALKEKLLTLIATIETNIDYPEYDDVEQLTTAELLPKLTNVQDDLLNILDASKASRYVTEGVSVAIVGLPNAGKSSLLNALLDEEKAIVTDVPGTTRDIVEGTLQVGQVLLNFKDTAGIRKSDDKVEKIGVEKSLDQIQKSDLIIHVVDAHKGMQQEDKEIKEAALGKKYILVHNKSDLKEHGEISISAKHNKVEKLLVVIKRIFKDIDINNDAIVNNIRQLSLIDASKIAVDQAITALENGMTPDTVIIDIQKAWEDLANILGRAEQSDLLDNMFKNFCLGK